MNKYQQKPIIMLSNREERQLHAITRRGKHKVREIKRAHVLLKSAAGLKDADIAEDVGTTIRTVERIRARYAEGGVDRALHDAARSGQPPKLDEKAEAHLVAIACSNPPEGSDHWTLELLQERMIADGQVETLSTVALWHRLRERGIKPWREKNGVHSDPHTGIHQKNGGRS